MAGLFRSIQGFFDGQEKGVPHDSKLTLNSGFVKYYLEEENMSTSLRIVEKVVGSESWLEEGQEVFYENGNLKECIEQGKKIRQIQGYLAGDEAYRGVDLNDGVLKMALSDFLNRIDHYLFYAFSGNPQETFQRVDATPAEIIEYVIEERYAKLLEDHHREQLKPDFGFALRIFEFDLLIHKADVVKENRDVLESFAEKFSESVMTYHVEAHDAAVENKDRWDQETEKIDYEETEEEE